VLVAILAGTRRSGTFSAFRLTTVSGVRWFWNRFAVAALILLNASTAGWAQNGNATQDGNGMELTVPPRSLIVDAAKNELIALHHKDSYLRYRMETSNERGRQVRDVIESKDGTVARLIMKDGRPLTPDEDKAERQRLNDMIADPVAYAKHVKNTESEKKMADTLVPLMADAMINTYTPGQPQSGKNNGALEIVLDYKPNPKWIPPSTEAQALTGLQGRVWIDAKTHYVVRMEGTIFRSVNFGWGMLAHIYPGGKLELDQINVTGDRWIFTDFSMRLTVRALLVKTLNIHNTAKASDFNTLAPMSYQDAIRLLLATPLTTRS
jgi:hypothetical protein